MEVKNCGNNLNIMPIKFGYNQYASIPRTMSYGLSQDVFEKSNVKKEVSFKAWPKILSELNGVTTENYAKLSDIELKHLLDVAKAKIDSKLAEDTTKFTDILKDNLDKLYKNKNYVFVSIGQSPAVLAEALNIKGVETAICPISKLGKLDNVNNILKNPELKKYFDYLKKLGLGTDKIKSSKKHYVFVDYTVTGKSLKRFEELLRSKKGGYNLPNVEFISLQKILNSSPQNEKEKQFIENFIKTAIHDRKLKDYSPIFKLPVEDIHKVQEYRNNTPVNENFNMLKFIIMNKNINHNKSCT